MFQVALYSHSYYEYEDVNIAYIYIYIRCSLLPMEDPNLA